LEKKFFTKKPGENPGLRLLTNPNLSQTGWMKVNKNHENQSIDFRLLTTKKEKPRFILLCQQSEAG
jgi:hypothetical protein